MRQIAVSLVMYALAVMPADAADAWQEYVFEEDEFAVYFPAPPSTSSEPYETSITETLTAKVHSVEYDNVLFKVRVVELDGLIGDGTNFVLEAAYHLMRMGNVIFNDYTRIGSPGRATFGLGMIVDTDDGRRIRSSFYADNERLYLVDAIVLPERGDLDQAFPSRFEQTLRFDLDAPLNSGVLQDEL
jgi:hypothetical protein